MQKLTIDKLWLSYVWLTEQPQSIDEPNPAFRTKISKFNRRNNRVISFILYISCTVFALVVSYMAVYYLPSITHVQNHLNSPYDIPDMILCPRMHFLLNVTNVKREKDASGKTIRDGTIMQKWVSRLREPLVYAKLVEQHYKHAVWYNIDVIGMINITVDHVDELTSIIAGGDNVTDLPEHLHIYMVRLQLIVRQTYHHDLQYVAKSRYLIRQTASSQWRTPMHPILQQLIAKSDQDQLNNVTLLWWAIIRPLYIRQYTSAPDPTSKSNSARRFQCQGYKCPNLNTITNVWLDNHFCVLFDRSTYKLSSSVPEASIRTGEPLDEFKMWIGDLQTDQIRMSDFYGRDTDSNGWYYRKSELKSQHGLNMPFKQVRLSNPKPRSSECQKLIQQSIGNPVTVRDRYCQNKKIEKYNVFLLKPALVSRGFTVSKYGAVMEISETPTFTLVQKVGIIGGIFGLVTGFNLSQFTFLVGSKLMRLKNTHLQRYQFLACATLVIFSVYWLVTDLRQILDYDYRYVITPILSPPQLVPIPVISFGGDPQYSRYSFNHTKLLTSNVTPELLNYMTLSSVAKTYYNHLDNGGEVHKRMWDVVPKPTYMMFSSYYPYATELKEIEDQYDRLTQRLSPKLNESINPYDVLQMFMLDKCAIIQGCSHGDHHWDCCHEFEFEMSPHDVTIFNLEWRSPNDTLFGHHNLKIYINVDEYKHSDQSMPYLPSGTNLTDAATRKWLQRGRLRISLYYKAATVMNPRFQIGPSLVRGELSNNHSLYLDLTANVQTQMSPKERPAAKCVESPVCHNYRDDRSLARLLTVAKHCECVLCSTRHQNQLATLIVSFDNQTAKNSTCCTDRQVIRCLMFKKEMWHVRHCALNGQPSNTVQYPSLNRHKQRTSFLNLFTYGYDDAMHCSYLKLVTGNSSGTALDNTVDRAELRKCQRVEPCTTIQYDSKLTHIGLKTKQQHEESPYMIFELSMTTDLNLGTREVDNFSLYEVFSLSIGLIGLFLGLSMLPLVSVVLSKPVKQGLRKRDTVCDKLKSHWERSIGFTTRPEELIKSQKEITPPLREEYLYSIVESTPVTTLAELNESDEIIELKMSNGSVEEAEMLNGKSEIVKSETETAVIPKRRYKFEVCIMLACVFLTIIISIKITWFDGSNSLLYDRANSMQLNIEKATPDPIMALCQFSNGSTEMQLIKTELNKLECWYRGDAINCSKLFPLYRYVTKRNMSCVVTASQRRSSPPSKTLFLYEIKKLMSTNFVQYWVGDMRTFCDPNLMPRNQRMVERVNYFAYQRRKSTDCMHNHLIRRVQSCDSQNATELCSINSNRRANSIVPDCHTAPCILVDYDLNIINDLAPTVERFRGQQTLQVVMAHTSHFSIYEKHRYNWAMMFTIIGGYVDMFVGVSLLNLVYLIYWLIDRFVLIKLD